MQVTTAQSQIKSIVLQLACFTINYHTEHLDYTCHSWSFPTFVVDLKSYRSHTLIWLQVKPHLMGHADYQIRNKATGQAGGEGGEESQKPPIKFLLSCGQQWNIWFSSLQSKQGSNSQLLQIKLLEHQCWKSLLWLSLLFLQNAPTGEWKDHSMFTLSGLPAAFQACELTVANTKENSNQPHCVKKKKKRVLGNTDHFESLI